MARPTIGIGTYHRNGEGSYGLPGEYVDAVRRAGAIAVLMPPGEPRPAEWLASVDGLILAGGGDVDPQRYGSARAETADAVDEERDELELALIRSALETRLPTLAICRGLQLLNVALGGTLVEHLPVVLDGSELHRTPPRLKTTHPVDVDSGSRLARLLGAARIEGVSWHHQAIDRLAAGLHVVARAPDEVVEAVELDGHPELVAVQWHPEMTAASDPAQARLFDALVADASERRARRTQEESPCG